MFCFNIKCWIKSDVTHHQVCWPILRICALRLTHPKCSVYWHVFFFTGRVLARISILLWFKVHRKRFENRNRCHIHQSVCTRKQSQILDILGNIEILARIRPGKMAHISTLYNNTYHIIAEDILHRTPQTRLECKLNYLRLCAHLFTWAKVFLGV